MKAKKLLNYFLILTFLISSLIFVQPAQAATGKYHIKVNRLANTVTVYERQSDGSYKPIKAMPDLRHFKIKYNSINRRNAVFFCQIS